MSVVVVMTLLSFIHVIIVFAILALLKQGKWYVIVSCFNQSRINYALVVKHSVLVYFPFRLFTDLSYFIYRSL